MQPRPTPLLLTLVPMLSVLALATACDEKEPPVGTGAPAAGASATPTSARANERARQRWAVIEKADWVAAYEFMAPEAKRDRPLGVYLQKTQRHKYERMHVIEVMALKGDVAYVRAGGLWTPQGPEVDRVELEPGQTLTQDIEVIETWRWVDGDWFYVRPDRPEEFFEAHPEMRQGSATPAGG